MKQLMLLFFVSVLYMESSAQDLSGLYQSTGYAFNPFSSLQINKRKTLIQVAPNRYQLDLGNLGPSNYYFQFDVDASNNLVNWSAVGTTPAAPASGFMNFDNPSGTSYPSAPILPGVDPYLHSTYNNRYDPINKVFYLHYGYATGSTSEFQYTRQIYEKLEWILIPTITSVSPLTGTAFTEVTINGSDFSVADSLYGVRFGGLPADSMAILSDTVIKAWVGQGRSGDVIVKTVQYDIADTFPGFTYVAVPPIPSTGWQYIGAPGFSATGARNINAAAGKDDRMYVGFVDNADGKARVMRLDGNDWAPVGEAAGAVCGSLQMQLDTADHPVVMFTDSANTCYTIVKRFDGVNWVDLGLSAQFLVRDNYSNSLAIDGQNNVFISYSVYENDAYFVRTLKYNGTTWSDIGVIPISDNADYGIWFTMSIGKNNNPYVFYPESDSSFNHQASIQMHNGQAWTQVGTRGFTNNKYGNFFPVLDFDTTGNPVAAFQEDNGFERLSVFRFDGNNLNYPLGRLFSRGRARYISQAIGKNNGIHVAYVDASYNNRGTVLSYDHLSQSWDTVGARGALPFNALESNALVKDSNNDMYIAFSDLTQNGRVSVMKYAPVATGFIWTGAIDNTWENPGNWSGGLVPMSTSNVFINAGGMAILNSNTSIQSINVNPGGTLTILTGKTLTVTGP